MQTRELCNQVVREMIEKKITRENMGEYLAMLSRFPQMSFENILLLMAQKPDASAVCGDGAWNKYGAKVNPGQKPIALLCPVLGMTNYEDEDETEEEEEEMDNSVYLDVIPVFDVSQVDHPVEDFDFIKPNQLEKGILDDILRNKYHFTITIDNEGKYGTTGAVKHVMDMIDSHIYLHPENDDVVHVELLKCYTNLLIARHDYTAFLNELADYAVITVCKYFSLPHVGLSIRSSELFSVTQEEKRSFLQELSGLVFEMITELQKERILTFNQTAFCNIFFGPNKFSDAIKDLAITAEMADTTDIHNDMLDFLNWTATIDENIYSSIRAKRNQRILFSFPPVPITEEKS